MGGTSTRPSRRSPESRACGSATSFPTILDDATSLPERSARRARRAQDARPAARSSAPSSSTSTAAPTGWTRGVRRCGSCQLSVHARRGRRIAVGQRGALIGAYGWLEDLQAEAWPRRCRSASTRSSPTIFQRPQDPPLVKDAANFGHIHAPSLDHAVAAAILRNGYLANATPQNPETLAINLTLRAGAPRHAGDRGHPQRAVARRAARLPAGAQPARLRRPVPRPADLCAAPRVSARGQPDPRSPRDAGAGITAVEARNVVDGRPSSSTWTRPTAAPTRTVWRACRRWRA